MKMEGFNILPYFHDCPQNLIDYVNESIEKIKRERSEKMLFENRNFAVFITFLAFLSFR